ncbi:MAG: hypothetical protein ABR569_10145 [Gaiellaceae bacterium]
MAGTAASARWPPPRVDLAWAGFDIVLALLLLGIAGAAWRRSP